MLDWVRDTGRAGRRRLRGPRRSRQGRCDQAHPGAAQPALLPDRRAARRRPSARSRSGTSSATSRSFPPPARSSSSTAAGTTVPASRRCSGFCTPEEHRRFLRQCPQFERMLVEDGIVLLKYWFSVSDEEQERRFQARIDDPTRRWKLSGMDLESRRRFVDFSRAKDEMFVHTDTDIAPWHVVEADEKRNARLNCIAHLLSSIPYEVTRPDRSSCRAAARRGVRATRPLDDALRAGLRGDAHPLRSRSLRVDRGPVARRRTAPPATGPC